MSGSVTCGNPDNDPVEDQDGHVRPAGPMWGGASSAVSPPGVVAPPPQQHCMQALMVAPPTLGPPPGPADNSLLSSFSGPWFSSDPVLYSMIPGVVHPPGSGLFMPQTVDLPEFTPHYSQSGLSNVAPECAPSESGPMFHSLEPAQVQTDDGSARDRREDPLTHNVDLSGTSGQPQQVAHPLFQSRDQPPRVQPQPSPPRAFGPRKRCHCTRSKCLKLYCACFANGLMCDHCECSNCFNNTDHMTLRQKAIQLRSGRNPDAFRTKIVEGRPRDVKGWHNKGCSCKRSGCLKNYCECYEANVMCTSSCKCCDCMNYSRPVVDNQWKRDKNRCPASVITSGVVEAVCGRMLAQAQKAERDTQSSARAEQAVLVEFGACLGQTVEALLK